MINSPLISDLLLKGEVHGIKEIMAKSGEAGMQTFDQALYKLYKAGEISYKDALVNADSANELRLMIKLDKDETGEGDDDALDGLALMSDDDEAYGLDQ